MNKISQLPIENFYKLDKDLAITDSGLRPFWGKTCKRFSEAIGGFEGVSCQFNVLNDNWFLSNSKVISGCYANLLKLYKTGYTAEGGYIVRTKKVRVYPEKPVHLNVYFGLSRFWFNRSLDLIRSFRVYTLAGLRRLAQDWRLVPRWAFDCPQRVREHAMADAIKATKNAIQKYKKAKQIQDVSFRNKRGKQGFGFDKQSLNPDTLFRGKHNIKFKATEGFPPSLEGTRLVKEGNRFYITLPVQKPILKPENQRFKIVALDPGVRTFISFFSPELYGKIGEGDFNKIYKLCLGLDKLISKTKKATSARQRRNMRRAQARLRWKIKDLINDLHHKTARFLCDRFDVILIPTFQTQDMVQKLHHKTSRNMLNFAHFRFKQFLKAKGEELSTKVIEVNEAYTSKTCSFCGQIHNIGSKKILSCGCGATVDRDLNGARNILLRALWASTPAKQGNC